MAYNKPWQSYRDQLHQLKLRGLVVDDEQKALEYLERIGYYRLSGYWYAFRERVEVVWLNPNTGKKPKRVKVDRVPLEEFKPGATFQNAVELYVFDKKLRLLVLDALERIEIALRVDISHRLGSYDAFAYLRPDLFHNTFAHDIDPKTGLTPHHKWLAGHAALVNRSREEFMRHNKDKYGLPIAIWVACEVWDFGTMSSLFNGMTETDQDAIAQKYGIGNGRVFASWLRSLNYLRNVCAHHSRLWNRNIIDQPKLPPVTELPVLAAFHQDAHRLARPFLLLCISQHMMKVINPASTWGVRLKSLLVNDFPDLSHLGLGVENMGVDATWQQRNW